MWLVTGNTVDSDANLGWILGIHLINNRVPLDWMAHAVPEGDRRYRAEVFFRQFHAAIEDRDGVCVLAWSTLGIRPVALETEAVDGFRAQQMVIFTTVRLVTSATAVPERSLVKDLLGFLKLCLSAMTLGAGSYRIRTHEARLVPRMRVMAANAIALRPRVLHFRALDLLCGFLMA